MTEEIKNFTPREIISELDRYIIGQGEAKRAVAIAMRNRWRRQQVQDEIRDEIAPKNIIMIGPTGVGKTEIARRLAKLTNAPFIKVEASKFTEVGYVGKDVESMIRELVDIAVNMVRVEEEQKVQVRAEELAEERVLDLLLPQKRERQKESNKKVSEGDDELVFNVDGSEQPAEEEPDHEQKNPTREKMRQLLRAGRIQDRVIEIDSTHPKPTGIPMVEIVSTGGSLDEIGKNLRDMFSQMMPRGRRRKKVKVAEALILLKQEEASKLIQHDEVVKMAVERTEQSGMVFIDEIDKVASRERASYGPDVSREGVQRDILPIVEGCSVSTKYGMVKTDHILFIAAGAFHVSKPSDLIPELQGRFPIRVEMSTLTEKDFLKILTEPRNSLTKQYTALMKTEGVDLKISKDALREIARYAAIANTQMENIGARRLHTIMEKVLDEVSFEAGERSGQVYSVDAVYVQKSLEKIVRDSDLSRYIL